MYHPTAVQEGLYQKCVQHARLNFTYGVGTRHFVGIAFAPNLRLYKMMVLNLLQVLEHDQATQLQNDHYFSPTGYLKGTRQHPPTLQNEN
jgi:hypothetical protein